MVQQSSAIEVFCCYARKDKKLLDKLKTHLSPLDRQTIIHIWYDGNISAGAEWDQEIKKHLNNAKIILLLVSPDFFASDYVYSIEMQQAMARHKRGDAKVIPVILRPVNWQNVSSGGIKLSDLQALPKEAKPVTRWTNRDEAWEDVAKGIERVVSELQRGAERTSQQERPTSLDPPVQESAQTSRQAQRRHFVTTAISVGRRRILIASLSALGLVVGGSVVWASFQPRTKPYMDITTFSGLRAQVWCIAWSPDNGRIVSAGASHNVEVWNATTGSPIYTYTQHTDAVTSVVWSPNGYRIASGSYDHTVQVWSSDGIIIPPNTDQPYSYQGHKDKVLTVSWSPDGKYIASGAATGDHSVQVWATDQQKMGERVNTYSKHTNSVNSVAWSPHPNPQGQYLIASGSGDTTVQVWEATTGETISKYSGHSDPPSLTNHVLSVAWSPNGKLIASTGLMDKTVRVWSLATGETLSIYRGHSQKVEAVAWSPDGKYIASAGADQTVQVWEALSGLAICTYTGHYQPVHSVAWSSVAQERLIASAGEDKFVRVWKLNK